MKNKNIFVLLFIICIGFLMPTGVFAKDSGFFHGNIDVDYRFFVEDGIKDNDVENLEFKLYDQTGAFTFVSNYDSKTKRYYFIEDYSYYEYRGSYSSKNGDERVYQMFDSYAPGLFDTFRSANDLDSFKSVFNNEKIKGSCHDYSCEAIHSIPMILEEVNHKGDAKPIKKIVFATIKFEAYYGYGTANNSFYFDFYITNNSCKFENMDDYYARYYLNSDSFRNMVFMRETAFDYSSDLLSKYAIGNIASSEIHGDNYLNKNFTSSEIASGGINVSNGSGSNSVQYRTPKDNYVEKALKDYCDCLPVFVQERKISNNIVSALTNPKTYSSGAFVLIISIVVAGIASLFMRRKKIND